MLRQARNKRSGQAPASLSSYPVGRRWLLFAVGVVLGLSAWAVRQRYLTNGDAFNRYMTGVRLSQQGHYPEAAVIWKQLRRENPDFLEPTLRLADFETRTGDFADAVSDLQDALTRHPDAPGIRAAIAEIYLKAADRRNALHWAADAVRAEPNSAAAHMALAAADGQNSSLEGALMQIHFAERLAPSDSAPYQREAQIYKDADDARHAEAAARASLTRSADNAESWRVLGWALQHGSSPSASLQAAMLAFQKSTELEPTKPDAFVEMADILVRQHRYPEALTALLRARQLAALPDFTGGYTVNHLRMRIHIAMLTMRVLVSEGDTAQAKVFARECDTLAASSRALTAH